LELEYRIIRPDGTERWSYDTTSGFSSTIAIGEKGTIYVNGGLFSALTPDGQPIWELDIGKGAGGSPAIDVDGTIYVAADDFYAINPDGTIKWKFVFKNNHLPALYAQAPVLPIQGRDHQLQTCCSFFEGCQTLSYRS